jgi:hypothetical protein
MIKHYEFEIGDLVQFSEYSFFDEYYNSFEKIVGIVVERSFKHVEDTTYKIKANEKDYWIEEDKIILLSKAPKGVSK